MADVEIGAASSRPSPGSHLVPAIVPDLQCPPALPGGQRSSSQHGDDGAASPSAPADTGVVAAAPPNVPGFACEQCGKVFAKQHKLRKHVATAHTDERAHVCPVPGCGKSYRRKDHLGRHVRNAHSLSRTASSQNANAARGAPPSSGIEVNDDTDQGGGRRGTVSGASCTGGSSLKGTSNEMKSASDVSAPVQEPLTGPTVQASSSTSVLNSGGAPARATTTLGRGGGSSSSSGCASGDPEEDGSLSAILAGFDRTERARNYVCGTCNKRFETTQKLRKHERSHNQLRCENCGKRFKKPGKHAVHVALCTGQLQGYTRDGKRETGRKMKKKSSSKDPPGGDAGVGGGVASKAAKDANMLARDLDLDGNSDADGIANDHDDDALVCPEVIVMGDSNDPEDEPAENTTKQDPSAAGAQQRPTAAESPKKLAIICPRDGCDFVLTSLRDYYTHEKWHRRQEGQKFFECEYCDFTTLTWKEMREHTAAAHVKCYVCQFCDRSYKTSTRLAEHVRAKHTHDADTVFPCKTCGNEYASVEALKKHMRSAHNVKMYKCNLCDRFFSYKSTLERHMALHAENEAWSGAGPVWPKGARSRAGSSVSCKSGATGTETAVGCGASSSSTTQGANMVARAVEIEEVEGGKRKLDLEDDDRSALQQEHMAAVDDEEDDLLAEDHEASLYSLATSRKNRSKSVPLMSGAQPGGRGSSAKTSDAVSTNAPSRSGFSDSEEGTDSELSEGALDLFSAPALKRRKPGPKAMKKVGSNAAPGEGGDSDYAKLPSLFADSTELWS